MAIGAGRLKAGLPPMPSVTLDSVTVGLHDLTQQSKMLESICRRIGIRLTYWLRRSMRDASEPLEAPLPSPEFLEAFRYYQAALLGLLKEQRERARLKGDEPTEEQMQAQFADELRRALQTFTPEERAFAMKLWGSNALAQPATTETPQ